jgi:hypothetical protein
MRAIFDYSPGYLTATVTSSSATAGFPHTNLSDIKPMKRWQSSGYAADQWVKYYNNSKFTFDSIFLNRFNFGKFQIQYADTDFTPGDTGYSIWEPIDDDYFNTSTKYFEGLVKDELYDEEYMHYFARKSTSVAAKYVALFIPISGNSPQFADTNYAIGNFLLGVSVDIWGASQDYSRQKKKKLAINEFDSGYVEPVKLGRTKRVLRGSFKNITTTEMAKIRQTYNPFVLYEDCSDPTKCYLVRNVSNEDNEQFQTDRPDLPTYPFEFTELT